MTGKRNNDVRLFFALRPTDAERLALASWQPPLSQLCGGHAVPADALHATLVFLGSVAQHRLEALQLAAQEVYGEVFELVLDKARYWGHNRIVYAAPDSVPPQLVRLVRSLEQRLTAHHFAFEQRLYKPHITLLRRAQWSDAPLPEMPRVMWQAHDFALMQSLPGDQGTRYQLLARFSLH